MGSFEKTGTSEEDTSRPGNMNEELQYGSRLWPYRV